MAKSLLLHCCCAHCTAYSISYWRQCGFEVSGLWYNPNIHPLSEHQSRLEAMQVIAGEMRMPLITLEGYELVEYLKRVVGDETKRCRHCFKLRLSKTAEVARQESFDVFTTSLLISPHQEHKLLRQVGEGLIGNSDAKFLYSDLRKRYSDSRHLTKGLNLYRQQYCGCLYSQWERVSNHKVAEVINPAPL
jgi:predicted adenine nucleotide alpha hydrolase (AANH) superfamily ATPase